MWIYILVWASLAYSLNSECDKKYSDITVEHSMCLPVNKTCNFIRHESHEMLTTLRLHNAIRNNTNPIITEKFPNATNMRIMEWDDELYEMAAKYVRQCVDKPDCPKCHQTGDTHVEQNFEYRTYKLNTNEGPGDRFRQVISDWAEEYLK
uniref:TSA: Tityus bahiensis Tbah02047 mRNA sequence n=1 Tax=Tityus bahiensis TaxID=50343 RepID=A0A0C9QKT2_TITBA